MATVCRRPRTTWYFCCVHEAVLWVADTGPWNRMRQTDSDQPRGVWQSRAAPWRLCTAYWVSHDRSFWKGLYIWWSVKAEAQYVWQSTTGESGTGSPRFHLMTSLHPSFVQASVLSLIERYEIVSDFSFFFLNVHAVFAKEDGLTWKRKKTLKFASF